MKNKTIYLKDYKVPNYKVEYLDLEFELAENWTIVTSEAKYYKNTESSGENNLILSWEDLELISISIDWDELKKDDYKINEEWLILENAKDSFVCKIVTKIHPETNTSLMGLYKSWELFCTQCESQGFRKITYYLDRPDVMTKFTTKITADKQKYPVLLSNWNKVDSWDLDNNRHFVKWEDPFKKPSYLFALVAWDLEHISDNFTTKSWKEVDLQIFTTQNNINKCDFAMESLKKAMKWDEDRFWLEYDLDLFMIVAVDDFNAWAMENKWLNIFNSSLVFATPKSATDRDYVYIEAVIGHEYFHNWTWDRVTCRDWFQLSLKEWLTVFRDWEFTSDMHSRIVKRIEDVNILRNYQFREDASPMTHPIRPASYEEIGNFYTVTVYEKWAEVVWMYQTILWKDGFRKWMDLYFKRHDWEAVTTEDFLNAMADANNTDLSQFSTWYNQAWTPIVDVESSYDSVNKKFTLNFKQSCPETPESNNKKPFIIPIKFGLIYKNWEEYRLDNDLILLTDFEQSFSFDNIEEEVIPSLLRNFSAPVKINYDYSYDDYAFLMEHETDEFNRFEAIQNFAKELIVKIYKEDKLEINEKFVNSFWKILNDNNLDSAVKAEIISLPSENEITDIIWKNIDPEKIHNILEFFHINLATKYEKELKKIYEELNDNKEYKIETKEIAKRKLKNAVLKYINYLDNWSIAFVQYNNSNNMTDTMSAFTNIINSTNENKQDAIDDFYEKWQDDKVVIDKWFSTQAISKNTTIDDIIKLSENKVFTIKNPNKVRSLYSAFATHNSINFHSIDWSWYKLIASKVIELDKLNPPIAARLAKTLINWKLFDKKRQEKILKQLKRISETKWLSKDVNEVVGKSL